MTLRVHHLSCGTFCPFSARLIHGQGSLFRPARLVCHCLLIEGPAGLTLVDTGFGKADLEDPSRFHPLVRALTRPTFDPEETAVRRLAALGFSPADVRHIVLTHLDMDHAGGLADFPAAEVHLLAPEHAAAMAPLRRERLRYVSAQWAHGPRWVRHPAAGERWFGFDAVRALDRADDLLLVPLHGHTRGHAGVAVRTGDGWLLHCGDAYFFHGEVEPEGPPCPLGLSLYQRLIQADGPARWRNQARLRELQRDHGTVVRLFSAHCPVEFDRFAPPQHPATEGAPQAETPHREA